MKAKATLIIIGLLLVLPIGIINSTEGQELDTEVRVMSNMVSFEAEVLIGPGEDFFVQFNPQQGILTPKREQTLDPECSKALDMVPDWMKINLTHKFRLLSREDGNTFAKLITGAPDEKYRDEIGFVISHSTPQTLTDDNFFPQLITHNAQLIYEHDQYLDYVEIVEKDNYTTLAYRQLDNSTVELSREDYYWFVVHPKLGDELPTYVDPDYDYTSDPPFDRSHGVAPPVGKFWRDWFFVNNKSGQPLLTDRLAGKNTTLDAVKAINGWISASMKFTSNNERPVQPVRIYEKGIGRCGEYQDMRSAAARAALIPVVASSNTAEDHVWNEFWDLEWYHWDGMINNPHAYEKGWGKTISSVWNCRGDGYTWSVTSRYSEVSTITATVIDRNNMRVDGADIDIYTENFYQPDIKTVTYSAVTDSSGMVTFDVGDERNYWGTADTTDLGSDPINPADQNEIVLGSEAGEEYTTHFRLPQSIPDLIVGAPAFGYLPYELDDPFFNIEFEVVGQITRGDARVAPGRFDHYQDGGNIDFFLADEANMAPYRNGLPVTGYYFGSSPNLGKRMYRFRIR